MAAELPRVLRLDPADFVGARRKTAAYRPHNATDWWGKALDGRPVFTFREADRMRRDPQVQFGLRILRAPLYQLPDKVSVAADSPRVARFVQSTFRNVWDHSLRRMLTSTFTYGISVGETTHRVNRGRVVFDRWDDVHPRDAVPLEWVKGPQRGQWCGVRVNGSMGSTAGTGAVATGGTFDLRVPHAFWFSGESEYGNYWGRPRLADVYEPWLEKRGRHGAVDCRRLWFKKGAFSGGSLRYPMGTTQYTDATGQTVAISNQDVAREILEKFESGGVLALPNIKDPTTGDYLWVFEPPKSGGEVGNLIEYPKQLDREILVAWGIPPEMVEAATVGSGYSGRAIPAQVFFASCDEIAALLIDCIDRQIIRPLVTLNCGTKAQYKLRAQSLAELVAQDPGQAGKLVGRSPEDGPAHAAAGAPGPAPPSLPPRDLGRGNGVRMSHEAHRQLLRGLKRYSRAVRLSWAPAQTKKGTIMAVGFGPNQGQKLYGRDAKRALAGRPRAVTEKGTQTVRETGRQAATNRPAAAAADSPSPPKVTHDELSALAEQLPPEDKAAWPKVTRTYRAIRDAVFVKVTELGTALSYGVAPAVLDTAEDYMIGKASVYGDIDGWKHATGISWGFTQTIVKHAIGLGFKLAGHKAADADGGTRMSMADMADPAGSTLEAGVAVITAALEAMHAAAGADIPVDATAVRELLAKRLGGGEKAAEGTPDAAPRD
jgi:hypothetical protein